MALHAEWSDSRISDRFAAIDQDLNDLRRVPETLAAMGSDVKHLSSRVDALHVSFGELSKAIQERDDLLIQERGQNRRALWALTGVLGTALIGAVGAVIASGVLG